MRSGWAVALFSLLVLPISGQQAPSAAPVPAGAAATRADVALGENLRASLAALGEAMALLNPGGLHIPDSAQQALGDSQASIRRNLRDAMPGLIAGFEAEPDNVAAAFRLYRDVSAVVTVAQRSAEMLPAKDAGAAQPVESTADAVSRDLGRLGDFIEARGQADYSRLRQAAARPAAPAAAPAPRTLIIGDANGAKPATKKKIPH